MVPAYIDALHEAFEPKKLRSFDAIVVGAGFAGAVAARELAERAGRSVAVVEKRAHIAGNAYDHYDGQGVLIHEYGPHIFHSNFERVYSYLSRFTKWRDYEHEVLAFVRGSYIPVPFNLNSIDLSFSADEAAVINDSLVKTYGNGSKVPIIELRGQGDPLLRKLADYVYENIFLHYTVKQWGLRPEEIDPAVTARVPVLVGRDNRYFQDRFQGMPTEGYTALFQRLLNHPNIELILNLDARQVLSFQESEGGKGSFKAIEVCGAPYEGILIYTGALDELSQERLGMLPYRSLEFVYRHHKQGRVQPCGTVNFTVSEDFTRSSEYTWLTGQETNVSTIAEEYPVAYVDPGRQIPYYPIISEDNLAFYNCYRDLFKDLKNFYTLGRLAEYHYYNMDQIVLRALELIDEIS